MVLVLRIAVQTQQTQSTGNLRFGSSRCSTVDVSFVDHHQIGQLHHAFFDGLQVVTGIRQLHQTKHIGHIGHCRFRLPNTHGFNNHHVVACCFADQHAFTGFFCDTA